MHILQLVLTALYAALPPLYLLWVLRRWRRRRRSGPIANFILICLSAIGAGVPLLWLNAKLMGGQVTWYESGKLIYFLVGALCLLKVIDNILLRGFWAMFGILVNRWGRPIRPGHPLALLGLLLQRVVMLLILIPYFFALLITYRPKVHLPGSPATTGLEWNIARFTSADGIPLRGWWISAAPQPDFLDADDAQNWGTRTILLCHGIGSGKERLLGLATLLARQGFNTLLFDFRAHGESGGNFAGYGIAERLDVLAAAAWAKSNHSNETLKVFGIGLNTGAAALIAASAEQGGDNLDGLVLYEPFARLQSITDDAARQTLPGPVGWLVKNASLPIASAHAGQDLSQFAPADLIDRVWPRPILIVHTRGQTWIPYTESMDLFQRATAPKEQYFPSENFQASRRRLRTLEETDLMIEMFRNYMGTSHDISEDPGVRRRTLQFLKSAEPQRVL